MVATFEGRIDAWRFAHVERALPERETPASAAVWKGPPADAWETSLDEVQYQAGVQRIRAVIREGGVYQVNLCRTLSAPLVAGREGPDAVALSQRLTRGNPARYASRIVVPESAHHPGVWIVSASPELYLGINGATVESSPIKGTAAPGVDMLDKDHAENVMITDLIRNDLSRVAMPGTVRVPELLAHHPHPGLTHLQSTVAVTLAPEFEWTSDMWPAILEGTFPPGSVSGAPKAAALDVIRAQEPTPRGPYCGGIGWIDADSHTAELAVGIRTFWWTPERGGRLHFGTGAGITWGSDPAGEWAETELKATRLIALASADRLSA